MSWSGGPPGRAIGGELGSAGRLVFIFSAVEGGRVTGEVGRLEANQGLSRRGLTSRLKEGCRVGVSPSDLGRCRVSSRCRAG